MRTRLRDLEKLTIRVRSCHVDSAQKHCLLDKSAVKIWRLPFVGCVTTLNLWALLILWVVKFNVSALKLNNAK